MRFEAAIVGDLVKFMEQEIRDASEGVRKGVDQTSEALQRDLRSQVTGAGMGEQLAKAWKKNFYENKGMNAAALVYSKALLIHRAFEEGTLVHARHGSYLAIPTPEAYRYLGIQVRGRSGVTSRGGNRNQKISPENLSAAVREKLRFVPAKNGRHGLLVLDELRVSQSGRISSAKRTKKGALGKGAATIVMFVLIKQAQMKKRLNVIRAFDQAKARLLPNILRYYVTTPVREV